MSLDLIPNKETETIQFLKDNEPEKGYYLCFSGGKDSIVCKHLLILSGCKWTGGYVFTGIDPPEIVQYIKKYHPDIKITPAPSFFKNTQKKGPPTMFRRWCCDTQKKRPQDKIEGNYKIIGIRAEESSKRKKRGRINIWNNKTNYHPIFYWKEWEIWEFIEKYNLPYCHLYDDPNCNRIGCCICPFQKDIERKNSMKQYPGYWKAYKKALKFWYFHTIPKITKRKNEENVKKFYQIYPTFEEFWYWLGERNMWKPKEDKKKNKLGILK